MHMLENFGEYLRRRRKQAGYTQDRLANALSRFNATQLCGLDSVTISRWERATTEPTAERQKQVIRFFGDSLEEIFPFRSSKSQLLTPERSVSYLVRHHLNSPKLAQKVGGFPASDIQKYQLLRLGEELDTQPLLELALDYDHALFNCEKPVSLSQLESWSQQAKELMFGCTRLGHYFGHLICLPLKPACFERLIQAEIQESEIALEDLATVDEPHCLYVYSLYGASRVVASIMLVNLARYISEHKDQVLEIGALCATSDGARLARAFHLQVQAVGPEVNDGSVRYQGQEVGYITYSASIKKVLDDNGLRRIMSAFT